jgi:hypothetical protein
VRIFSVVETSGCQVLVVLASQATRCVVLGPVGQASVIENNTMLEVAINTVSDGPVPLFKFNHFLHFIWRVFHHLEVLWAQHIFSFGLVGWFERFSRVDFADGETLLVLEKHAVADLLVDCGIVNQWGLLLVLIKGLLG